MFSLIYCSLHYHCANKPEYLVNAWMNGLTQRMYCENFTIGNADCLVMKKIGNRPITEADTDC